MKVKQYMIISVDTEKALELLDTSIKSLEEIKCILSNSDETRKEAALNMLKNILGTNSSDIE